MMVRIRFVLCVAIGIFLMTESVFPLEAIAPAWSYRIENMTEFAMSENGEYLIVLCGEGPPSEEGLYEKGKFYVFNQGGNIVKEGIIESSVTVVDIANNGTFFIGTRSGYYFSSGLRKVLEDTQMESEFMSVSMSENGKVVVAGTDKEIFIFDLQGERKEEINQPIGFVAVSDSGDIFAGTDNNILFYDQLSKKWVEAEFPTNGKVSALAVSGDGSTIAYGTETGQVSIRSSQLEELGMWESKGEVTSIAVTSDGTSLVCGTREGEVFYLHPSGEKKWDDSMEEAIKEVAISSDGKLVAVLTENIVLFDSSGEKLQELKSSGSVPPIPPILHMQLSESGEILSYRLHEELVYLELYQRDLTLTYEYMLPSREVLKSVYDKPTGKCLYEDAPQQVMVADINGDGQNEIICSFSEEIVVLNSEGNMLRNKTFAFQPEIAVVDLTSDFVPEVIVTSRDNCMKFIVLDGDGPELARHEFYSRWYDIPPSGGQDISIHALWAGDIDNDGITEVVCMVNAVYSLEPRGIYVFEYPSFKEEWYYSSAPKVNTVNIVDLDNDGTLEIVGGTSASCHGRKVKDTDDCHAYVFALNFQGELLWIREIGSGYTSVSVAVADLDGDGTNDVVCGGRSYKDGWGELIILDAEGSYKDKEDLGIPFSLNGVSDLDSDGYMEILTADENWTLSIYDHKLQLLKKGSVGILTPSIMQINDIDGDKEKEIIAVTGRKVVILDREFTEEWRSESFPVPCSSVNVVNLSTCKNDLLIVADKLYCYSYRSQSSQPCTLPSLTLEEEIEQHIIMGTQYSEKENYLRAIEEYDLAIIGLQELGNTERLQEVTKMRQEAYEKYTSELSSADEIFKQGVSLLEGGDFQEAVNVLLNAKRKYERIGRLDKVQEVDGKLYEVTLSKADQLYQEGTLSWKSKDFLGAKEALPEARELYYSLGMRDIDKVREIDFILSEIQLYDLALADILVYEGKKEESPLNYRGAIQKYEGAIRKYEEALGPYDQMEGEDAEKVGEVLELLGQARAKNINIWIIRIIFVITSIAVTYFYFTRKKGGEESKSTYLISLMVLAGVLVMSHIAIFFSLGYTTYLMTISMCLLFFMVLGTYWRRL